MAFDFGSLAQSLTGGIVGAGVQSLFNSGAARQQYNYQRKLNEQQQQYARENADTQYQRQRDLTRDAAYLNKQGMVNAGINPAFADGSTATNTASVDAAAAPSAGSAPTVQPANVLEGVQALTQLQQSESQSRLQNSEAALNETKQLTAFSEQVAKLRELKANASSAEAKAEIDNAVKELRKQYEAMNIKNQAHLLDDERAIADVRAFYAPEEWNTRMQLLKNQNVEAYNRGLISKKDYESYDKRLDNELLQGRARASLDYANAAVAPTLSALNRSQSSFLNSQTEFNNKTMDNRVESTRIANIPKDTKEILMRSPWIKKYMDALDRGEKPNYETKWHVDQILLEHGLRDSKFQGINIGAIIDAIFR